MTVKTIKETGYNISWREYHFQASAKMRLDALEKDFPQFLSPHPLVQTSGRKPNEPLLGIIAHWQGKPAGLIIMEKQTAENGLVLVWHVLKPHQGFGLGRKLVEQLERYVRSTEVHSLTLSFREDSRFRSQINKTLQRLGWQAPKKELMLYKFSPKQFMQMPWCQHLHLPKAFEIFSWDTLTKTEKQHILTRQQQTNWYPAGFSPQFESPGFEALNSVGLRYQGEVVGWMVTHRVHPNVIEYSSLFVSPERQSLGRGYHLMVESVRRQHSLGIAHGIFQVQANNKAMLSFVERRMAKTIVSQTSRWFANKLLV